MDHTLSEATDLTKFAKRLNMGDVRLLVFREDRLATLIDTELPCKTTKEAKALYNKTCQKKPDRKNVNNRNAAATLLVIAFLTEVLAAENQVEAVAPFLELPEEDRFMQCLLFGVSYVAQKFFPKEKTAK